MKVRAPSREVKIGDSGGRGSRGMTNQQEAPRENPRKIPRRTPLSDHAKHLPTVATQETKWALALMAIAAVLVMIGFSSSRTIGWVFLVVLFVALGIFLNAMRRRSTMIARQNALDFRVSEELRDIEGEIRTIAATPIPDSRSTSQLDPLVIGEINRHFDTETVSSIEGWMRHQFHLDSAWGAGIKFGGIGIGVGNVAFGGTSTVSLSGEAVTRTDLMGDGFMAVLERRDGDTLDVVRVVCPSEPTCQALARQVLRELGEPFGKGSHTQIYTERAAGLLEVSTDVSYVADRLHAIVRLSEDDRPRLIVSGAPLTAHALLGATAMAQDVVDVPPTFPKRRRPPTRQWP